MENITDNIMNQQGNIANTMITGLDFGAVGLYFFLMICTGIYSMLRPNRETLAGYFLAGRFMWWLPIGASLFASNIGTEHFIGLAGSGAASGIYVGAFELNALILLQVLGWIFLPVFIASGVNTLPEYMNKRFGGRRIQTSLAVLSISLYIFTKISVNLYSGAIFIQQAFRWTNLYLSVIILVGLTALLTIGGGLSAVIYTDTLQFFIMNFGSFYVAIKAFQAVGGYESLKTKYLQAIPDIMVPNTTCGIPREDSWVILRDADPTKSNMPWPGFIFGQTPASIWYWCADQMMVQRVMAAKSLSHAQGATIFAGFTKLLPLFVMVMPGMISRVLFPNEIGCVDPVECNNYCGANTCTNYAYPKLVFSYMPNGMKGVMLAVMLSALVSDLTSIFNSASTLFTMDIWTLSRPNSTEKEKIFISRLFILLLVAFSILWIPIIEQTQGGELYIYIQAIAAYLSPPIAAVYCLAICWKGINEPGAFWSLISGFAIGITRMGLDFFYKKPPCYEEDSRPLLVKNFHYMYFAMLLFWTTILVAIVVSKITKPIEEWRLIRTTYWTRFVRSDRKEGLELTDPKEEKLLQKETNLSNGVDKEETKECSKILITEEELRFKRGRIKRLYKNWIKDKEKSDASKAEEAKMLAHIEKLTHLDQKRWEKAILNTFLAVILGLATFLYVFFSINPFTKEEIQSLQNEKISEIQSKMNNLTIPNNI